MVLILDDSELEFIKFFHDGIISGPYALGVKLTLAALDYLKIKKPKIKDLLVIAETRHCFIDGIQVIAKTTFGCGDLVIKNYGKLAFTMLHKESGRAIRVSVKPDFQIKMTEFSNNLRDLFKKGEQDKIINLTKSFGKEIMEMKNQDLCIIEEVEITDNSIIENASKKHKEHNCENCGESILDYAIEEINGKILCKVCAKKDVYYKKKT